MTRTLTPIPRSPAWIRIPQFLFRPTATMERYLRLHGDIYNFGNPERAFLYVSNPQAIQQIFTANPALFHTSQQSHFFDELFGFNAIFSVDGEAHKQKRKLLMPPFHGDRIAAYSRAICETTERLTANWQPGQNICIRPYMQEITLQTILRIVFGRNSGDRLQKIQKIAGQMLATLSSPLTSAIVFFPSLQQDFGPWSPWGRFLQLRTAMDALIFAEIGDRQAAETTPENSNAGPKGEDLISLLLASRDDRGNPPDARQIRDELVAILVAGHETTASALCWALYWIHYLPEVERKLRAELATSAGDPAAIAKLPYLGAVCAETLRIYPIAATAFTRRLKEAWTLLDYDLAPGTILLPCIYQLHHREDLYPEPKQFRPERFLERQFSPYEYVPFGGGSRRCLGMALALHELKLAIATILGKFDLALTRRRPEVPVRRGVTLAPRGNLSLRVLQKNIAGKQSFI